jgi:NitT/TauT family transport system substrate-binding protein
MRVTSRRYVPRLVVTALLVASALVFLPSALGESSASQQQTKVRLSLGFQWQPQWMPLLHGFNRGFFRQQRINLEIQPTTGPLQSAQLHASRRVEFALTDLATYVTLRARGELPAKIVYVYLPQPTLGIVSTRPLPTPRSLVGKTYATTATSGSDQIIKVLLESNGVNPNGLAVRKLDFSVLYASLFQGAIDAAEARAPGSWRNLQQLALRQNRDIFYTRMADWGLAGYGYVLIASDRMIQRQPGLVRRMVAAVARSHADATRKLTGAAVAELLATKVQVADPEAAALDWQDFKTYSKGAGRADAFDVGSEVGLQLRTGQITRRLRPASLFTNQFVPRS